MNKYIKYLFSAYCFLFGYFLQSQNQYNKWYFGTKAGLDFMTSPPTAITGSLNTNEGCASVADINGNLLFYTDGDTIWNQNHAVMQNATNLGGNKSTTQSAVIVKQPGNSNIYFVFSLSAGYNTNLRYSVVDMNLASGLGAVTIAGVLFSSGNTEKLTAVRHCNGIDYWVLCRPAAQASLNAYLVNAAGLNTVPVGSSLPGLNYGVVGNMKTSPNGRKIAFANYDAGTFDFCDFDNSTGIASNVVNLGTSFPFVYGVEFSPDGTKLYGANAIPQSLIFQWNLCAGSPQAIAASIYSVSMPCVVMGMQLATDGKIYVGAANNSGNLVIINNPNNLGAACNWTNVSGFTLTGVCKLGLPNCISSDFNPPPGYTYTLGILNSCNNVSFSASATQNYQANVCSNPSGPCAMLWNFGDPLSGNANTSTLTSLTHMFTNVGTYTVSLVTYNSNFCTGANDTIRKIITIPFCVSVSSQSITCSSLGSATVIPQNGVGPFNYTWMPTGQTSSVATGLNPGTHTLYAYDNGTGLTYTTTTTFVSLVPYTATVTNSAYQPCATVATGTASVVMSGGSGNQSYLWIGPNGTQTTAIATGLSAGNHTVTVVDALTACSVTQTFSIGTPPIPLGITASANVASVCANAPISFNAYGYGGTPFLPANFNYSWSPGGGTADTFTAFPSTPGINIFTATVIDANNCTANYTISVNVIPNPLLTLSNVSVCGQQNTTLSVSGANSYTWSNGANTTTISDNPASTTVYSVTGAALGCTTAATASIVVKTVPVATLASNSPICANMALNLFASSGSSYSWTGPFGFVSTAQNPQINPATGNNNGVYNFTLTAANACTVSAAINVTVYATPLLSVTGSTVCTTQTINLLANAPTAITFSWTGPGTFTSSLQNPVINNPPLSASGTYSLSITDANGCTSFAIANVTVSALPVSAFITDSPKCEGSTLNFNSSGSTGGIVYSWSGPNGFTSAAINPVISPVSPAADGIYTLQLTTGPCVSSTTQSVTVYANPVPVIFNNSPVCEDKTFSLSVTASYPSYLWSGPLSYSNNTQSFIITNATTPQSGPYSVVVTDSNTCIGTGVTIVTVMPNPTLTVLGADVCYGSPALITASGATTYIWSGPDGFSAFTAQATIPSATNTSPLMYNVVGTALNTCTAAASVLVSTRPLPIAEATLTSRACVHEPVYFTGDGGLSYLWTGPLNFNLPLQNFSMTVQNTGMAGVYTLTVTDDKGCKGVKTVNLAVDDEPQGSLWSSNTDHCVPFCSDFKLSSFNTNIVNASWQIDNHIFSTDTFNYCFTKVGDYLIRGNFTNANDCKAEIVFVISTFPLPKADFSYSPLEPIERDEIQFESTSIGDGLNNWTWYFANNIQTSAGYTLANHVFDDAGVYPVAMVLQNKWGCEDTIVKAIKVEEDFYLFVPNAFTPNEDALNETFRAVGRGVKTFSMLIFDRWGEKVFESNDISTGWDGSYKGKFCKDDVYAWKITATNIKGKEKKLTGSVLLYR